MIKTGDNSRVVIWRVALEERTGHIWPAIPVETTVRVLGTDHCAAEIVAFMGQHLNELQRFAGISKFQSDETHYITEGAMKIFRGDA